MNSRLFLSALKAVSLATGLFVLPATAIEPFVVPDSTQASGSHRTHFRIELPQRKSQMFFQQCSNLGSESEVIVDWEGTKRSTYPRSIRSPHVVCRRHFRNYDAALSSWQGTFYSLMNNPLPTEALITLVNAGQGEVAWWRLEYPWPLRIHYVADGDHLVEEVIIRSYRTIRLPNPPKE